MEVASDIARAVRQTLESLQRAGVTHLKATCSFEPAPEPLPHQAGQRPARLAGSPGQHSAGAETSRAFKQVTSPGGEVAMPAELVSRPETSPPPARSLLDAADALDAAPTLTPQEKATQLQVLRTEVAACTRCKELADTRTQTVFGVGSPQARLVFVGEAPGADEDRQGEPFVGRAGQLLTDIITKGMKLKREDVYILNVLKCRPPGNRNPAPNEVINCRSFLDRQLEILQPEFLCCLGTYAAQAILNTEESIGRLRGKFHDYQGIPVLCTYHPAYLLRSPEKKKEVWSDIQILMKRMGLPVS